MWNHRQHWIQWSFWWNAKQYSTEASCVVGNLLWPVNSLEWWRIFHQNQVLQVVPSSSDQFMERVQSIAVLIFFFCRDLSRYGYQSVHSHDSLIKDNYTEYYAHNKEKKERLALFKIILLKQMGFQTLSLLILSLKKVRNTASPPTKRNERREKEK